MSYAAQTWARKLVVGNGIAKAVLRHLADVADGDGYSSYGFETICREVEHTPRAVAKAIAYLVEHNFLEKREQHLNGKCLSPVWRVLIPGIAPAKTTPVKTRGMRISPRELAPPKTQGNTIESSLRSDSENILFDDAGKPAPRKRRAPVEAKTALPADWQPNADLCAEVAAMGLDPVAVTRNVHQYWRLGQGEGVARTLRGWNQTYLNSADFLLRNGKCIMRPKVNGIDPGPRMVPL